MEFFVVVDELNKSWVGLALVFPGFFLLQNARDKFDSARNT